MLLKNQRGGLITGILSLIALYFIVTTAVRFIENRRNDRENAGNTESSQQAEESEKKASNILNSLTGD